MVRLETGHYAEVGLALWAVVLCLPPEDSAVDVGAVPAVVATQGRTLPRLGAVSELGVLTLLLLLATAAAAP